jgi:hypothetical protein
MRAAKLHLGRDKYDAPSCMAEGHIHLMQDVRATRCNVQGILPPQDSSSTLVASMASVWNVMPFEIKRRGISQSGLDKSGAFVQIETIFKDDNETILVVV